MSLHTFLVALSGGSFLSYGVTYFISDKMKLEFSRFGLAKFGTLVATLEILGAMGLFVGYFVKPIFLLSAGGLSLLMLLGVLTRLKIRDDFKLITPAFFFMLLNGYLFFINL